MSEPGNHRRVPRPRQIARRGSAISDFEDKKKERLSRQQAAERLADVAYAFGGGMPLELSVEGQRVSVPVADDMAMEREIKSKGGRVELDLEVSWSTADAAPPVQPDAAPPVQPDAASGQRPRTERSAMDETPDPNRRREEEMNRLRYEETLAKNAIRKTERRMAREYRTLAGEVEALGEDIKQARNIAAKVRAEAEPNPSDLLHVDHRNYPAAHGEEVVLKDGAHILIRPIEPADRDELKLGSEHVWALSRYRHSRAMGAYLDAQQLVAETEGDHPLREALIAISLSTNEGIGVGLYSRDPADPAHAEVDCTVLDLWQNRGVGTALAERLAHRAAQHGVKRLTARMLVDDEAAMHLLSHVADPVTRESDSGIVTVTARLRRPPG